MDWTIQDLGALGEFVGSLAVLVTLIYLARQISESNKLAKSSSAHDAMSGLGVINEMIVNNPVLADLMARLKSPDAEITPAESVQLEHFCLRLLNVYLDGQVAYDNGHMDDATYRIMSNDVEAALSTYPGVLKYYDACIKRYPSMWDHEIIQNVRDVVSRGDRSRDD